MYMIKPILKVLPAGIIFIIVFSCSTKKATLLGRGYHSLTSRYNILFNGEESLEKGVEELEKKAQSDFYAELPLEGMEFDDKVYLPGQSKSPYIQKAEEKAAKAVQKHSMNIGGIEYNGRMDEAMLLLAQARYYDQRYLAALDALNYALDTYYDSKIKDRLFLWRAKVYLKLGNTGYARRALTRIIKNPESRADDKAMAYAFLAESFRDEFHPQLDTAAVLLRLAALHAKSRNLKQKLAYKSAQVWEKLGKKDSAVAMTGVILQYHAPEEFILRTQWYRMHLTKEDTALHAEYLKKLYRYFKNYYFHRYYPDIHFRMAEIYEVRRQNDSAVKHYTMAARSPVKTLKKLAYSHMADIFWNRPDYLTAGKYLDSLLGVMDKNTLDYLLTSQRRRSIEKIMHWEQVIHDNDSILNFIKLDTATQRRKILAHIERLKKLEAQKNKPETKTKEILTGTFYFYNTAQVEAGREIFRERWGERKLSDLWFLKNKYGELDNEVIEAEEEKIRETAAKEKEEKKSVSVKPEYTPEYYLKKLPRTKKEADSLRRQILKAHLYLGINYAGEKIKEYDLAIQHLDTVLKSHPDPGTEAQAIYLLHKIYKKTHRPEKAKYYADLLTKKYPDNFYSQYILHPDSISPVSSKDFNRDFRLAYETYKKGFLTKALKLTEKAMEKHREHPDVGKFHLLKAEIEGQLYGIDAYIQSLENIQKHFPDSDYASFAANRIKKLKKLKIKYGQNVKDTEPYYLVFHQFSDSLQQKKLYDCLQNIYQETHSFSKRIFDVKFDDENTFTVTAQFLSPQSAEFVVEELRKKHCKFPSYFILSRNKFIHLQLTKDRSVITKK